MRRATSVESVTVHSRRQDQHDPFPLGDPLEHFPGVVAHASEPQPALLVGAAAFVHVNHRLRAGRQHRAARHREHIRHVHLHRRLGIETAIQSAALAAVLFNDRIRDLDAHLGAAGRIIEVGINE